MQINFCFFVCAVCQLFRVSCAQFQIKTESCSAFCIICGRAPSPATRDPINGHNGASESCSSGPSYLGAILAVTFVRFFSWKIIDLRFGWTIRLRSFPRLIRRRDAAKERVDNSWNFRGPTGVQHFGEEIRDNEPN